MYLIKETTNKADMTAGPPFGPGVAREIAERATRCEIWGSSFSDPGPDYTEFRLFDATGVMIDRRTIPGY